MIIDTGDEYYKGRVEQGLIDIWSDGLRHKSVGGPRRRKRDGMCGHRGSPTDLVARLFATGGLEQCWGFRGGVCISVMM